MAPAVRMYIDKFKGEVLIDEDHPLAVAQRAKNAAGAAAPSDSLIHGDPVIENTSSETVNISLEPGAKIDLNPGAPKPADIGLFALPPEQREVPAVQTHLEGLAYADLQAKAKEHGVRANQSKDDLVVELTLVLTSPAQPPEPTTG